MDLRYLFEQAVAAGASDLFIASAKTPMLRIGGELQKMPNAAIVDAESIRLFRVQVLGEVHERNYLQQGSFDAPYLLTPVQRFRLNFLETLSGPMVVARPIGQGDGLYFEPLGLPESLGELAAEPRGLILVTGSTGSGKSTTLSAMVNFINDHQSRHILTLEDPIEFIHTDKKSLITQRELNTDTVSFAEAVRSAMRENPDVIVIGEIRDRETMQAALNAALTGHLVLSTLHTANAIQAAERLVNLFPEQQRAQVAQDFGAALLGIVSQRLIPRFNGQGMIPAVELLLGTPSVRKMIGTSNYQAVDDLLREGADSGMICFNRAIYQLYRERKISQEDALDAVDNRDEFNLQLQGMERGVDAFRSGYSSGATDGPEAVDMHRLLRSAVKAGASDLVLSVGAAPSLRVQGELLPLDLPILQSRDTERLFFSVISPMQRVELETTRELDMAIAVKMDIAGNGTMETYRFRINGFYQRGSVGVVARVISSVIPDPETLNLPHAVLELCKKQQGLILVVGPTGSGKSTTMASLIDRINHDRHSHIITLEDPIEYVHHNILSVVEQRELHSDTQSYAMGMKYVLRQDPDVIQVGEMRDIETIAAVLTAAETGHLVFATLHTNSAPQTIDRIIDSFPSGQQNQIRQQLSGVLLAVVSQRLLTRLDGKGRVAAFELMVGTPPIQALIREGKTHLLQSSIETGHKDGMGTLERALDDLVAARLVSAEEANSLRRDSRDVKSF